MDFVVKSERSVTRDSDQLEVELLRNLHNLNSTLSANAPEISSPSRELKSGPALSPPRNGVTDVTQAQFHNHRQSLDGMKTRKKGQYEQARHPTHLRQQSSGQIQRSRSSKDQLPPYLPKRNAVPQSKKLKADFTLSPGDEHDSDDDWVSSESGITTPSHRQDSVSDGQRQPDILTPVDDKLKKLQKGARPTLHHRRTSSASKGDSARTNGGQTPVPRVATARQSEHNSFLSSPGDVDQGAERTPNSHAPAERQQSTLPSPTQSAPNKLHSYTRPPSSHSNRPPSMHSTHSLKFDAQGLRPHPLIRGHSLGQQNVCLRPSPLAPLTVMSQVAGSPPTSHTSTPFLETYEPTSPIPGSPESVQSTLGVSTRRTSFSSARSVATVPILPKATVPSTHPPLEATNNSPLIVNRSRTLSTSSANSASSAALSSLALAQLHLQAHPHYSTLSSAASTTHLTSFFPPSNHSGFGFAAHIPVEKIHPLLPSPYLTNHLTVLAHRTPLRESFDRLMRAKHRHGK